MAAKNKKKSKVKQSPAFGIIKKVKIQDVTKAEDLLKMMVEAGGYTGGGGTTTCCSPKFATVACTEVC